MQRGKKLTQVPIFTALYAVQTRSSDEKAVRLSLRAYQTRGL